MNKKLLALSSLLVITACSEESTDTTPTDGTPSDVVPGEETPGEETPGEETPTVEVPSTYDFASLSDASASGVSKSGQVLRHILINELSAYVGGLTQELDSAAFSPTDEGQVVAALDFYFRFDSDSNGGESLESFSLDLETTQATFDDVSSGKDIAGKLAGNDSATDHAVWSSEFTGWSDAEIVAHGGSLTSPEGLVIAFFETVEANALGRVNGIVRTGPDGTQLPVYLTESGLDLKQLIQKFLLMAVTFSQGTDDYLDDDVEGKGLLASNEWDGESPYTDLAHAWDEGFGYFGAAVAYGDRSDVSIADSAADDSDQDGLIDLGSEYSYGASVNAAKRDKGADIATDFSAGAFEAFLAGRALIQATSGELSANELDQLRTHRDAAVGNWDAAIAATVVHYINDVLADMEAIGSDDYAFADHAKHWSELKGFALGLQFNPRSPLSDSDFATFHGLVGDAPVLDAAGLDDYASDLIDARNLLEDAYDFAPENAQGW
ncbi:MAG: hypothetical protein ACJAYU_005031 [Bradymonadia bacterium]|jgi:hypothetical protein